MKRVRYRLSKLEVETMPRIVFDRANLFDGAGPVQPDMTVVVEGTKITNVVEGPSRN
jgi:hypothetical protein